MNPIEELRLLPLNERIKLVEELWNSIAEEGSLPTLTDAEKEELERRLSEIEADPKAGVPWQELKESILRRR